MWRKSFSRPGLGGLPLDIQSRRERPPLQATVVNPKTSTLTPHCSSAPASKSAAHAVSMIADEGPQSPRNGTGLDTGLPGGLRIDPELSRSMVTTVVDRFDGCRLWSSRRGARQHHRKLVPSEHRKACDVGPNRDSWRACPRRLLRHRRADTLCSRRPDLPKKPAANAAFDLP